MSYVYATRTTKIRKKWVSILLLSLIFAALTILALPLTSHAEEGSPKTAKSNFVLKRSLPDDSARPEVGEAVPSLSDLGAKMVKGLLYCVGALLLVLSIYRRFGSKQQAPHSPIEIVATKSIGPKGTLLVVEVDTKRLLLGLTGENLSFLSELSAITAFDESLHNAVETDDSISEQEKLALVHHG